MWIRRHQRARLLIRAGSPASPSAVSDVEWRETDMRRWLGARRVLGVGKLVAIAGNDRLESAINQLSKQWDVFRRHKALVQRAPETVPGVDCQQWLDQLGAQVVVEEEPHAALRTEA
jgi:hypothetical protein